MEKDMNSNAWPLRYRCSALMTELSSHLIRAGRFVWWFLKDCFGKYNIQLGSQTIRICSLCTYMYGLYFWWSRLCREAESFEAQITITNKDEKEERRTVEKSLLSSYRKTTLTLSLTVPRDKPPRAQENVKWTETIWREAQSKNESQ